MTEDDEITPGVCVVGRCSEPATARMSLFAMGVTTERDFCERCVRAFEGAWQRVDRDEQLALDF